ncbi:hypothetical protein [Erythrobacter sanguineus]|nr:hypothetical protein [Erythrobacter sanguineus]
MNPMLWISGLTTPFAIGAAAMSDGPMQYFFAVLAFVPIAYSIRAYDFWMKKDPDRLQSERYLIERQIVGRIGYKSDDGVVEAEVSSQPILIENPKLDAGDVQ